MKTPRKTILTLLATGLLSCTLLCQHAGAVPISGEVDMSGTVFLNNVALGSATATTGYGPVTVGGIPTGSFAGTAGDSVTWTPFGWNPPTVPVIPLWTYHDLVTGFTYSFNLSTVSVAPGMPQTNFFLNLVGTGTLLITGPGSTFDPTPGTWSFTISNSTGGPHDNFAFTFANSQTAVAPDSGSAVALLGIALAGIEGVRRALRARRS
jgi:VPDSG-CTERM motif